MTYAKAGYPDRKKNNRIFHMDSGFKGTVVNRAFLSLNGGSLEITLTVPLWTISRCKIQNFQFKVCDEQ